MSGWSGAYVTISGGLFLFSYCSLLCSTVPFLSLTTDRYKPKKRRKRTKDDQGRKLDHDIDRGKNTDELRRVVVSQKTNKGFFLD